MADEKEEHATRWLLQAFEQGVGGVPVHLLRRIDDHHPPAALARREREEGVGGPHIVHHDLGAEPPPVAEAPFDDREVAVTAGCDSSEDGMFRWHRQSVAAAPFPTGEHETRESVSQCRLTNAAWARDQPGVGEPAALPCLHEGAGSALVPDEMRVLTRC